MFGESYLFCCVLKAVVSMRSRGCLENHICFVVFYRLLYL